MEPNLNSQLSNQEESIDIKLLFIKFFRYWYFFALTVFVALVIAFLFNRYTKPVYEVKTTVLIKDDKAGQNLIGIGIGNSQQNLENEMGIINSYALAARTINNLNFEVSYYKEDNFITSELYKSSPFEVVMDTAHVQPINVKFSIIIQSNSAYQLILQAENASLYSFGEREEISTVDDPIVINKTYKFGEEIETDIFKFTILLTENFDKEAINQNLSFVFNDYQSLIRTFRSTKLEPINREASIIDISIKGGNAQKLSDYLNELTNQYLLRGIEKKNQIAENTIRFINSELVDITDSLTYTEGELQDFRVSNEFMDMDFKSTQVFEGMKQFQDQKAQLIVKAKYYRNLQDYLKKNQDNIDDIVIPSSMGIEDPLLS
ncbi:MAG: hypothetical protein RBR47_09245, partial [Bacteroidales bacterium]|nr:hypothetical protein [Bacteroidales bacterium]